MLASPNARSTYVNNKNSSPQVLIEDCKQGEDFLIDIFEPIILQTRFRIGLFELYSSVH